MADSKMNLSTGNPEDRDVSDSAIKSTPVSKRFVGLLVAAIMIVTAIAVFIIINLPTMKLD